MQLDQPRRLAEKAPALYEQLRRTTKDGAERGWRLASVCKAIPLITVAATKQAERALPVLSATVVPTTSACTSYTQVAC
jgi:hypothetical protein